jgi:hypothetical protein
MGARYERIERDHLKCPDNRAARTRGASSWMVLLLVESIPFTMDASCFLGRFILWARVNVQKSCKKLC